MPQFSSFMWTTIAISVMGLLLAVLATFAMRRRCRTEMLQDSFGQEYERAVRAFGNRDRAEAALESRRVRIQELGVHQLNASQRDEYLREWKAARAIAANDPLATMIRADTLVGEIMREEGCPADDPDERKIDLALIHPAVAEEYRAASDILDRQRVGRATREECKRAVLRYDTIFDSILGQATLLARLRQVS